MKYHIGITGIALNIVNCQSIVFIFMRVLETDKLLKSKRAKKLIALLKLVTLLQFSDTVKIAEMINEKR